MLDVNKVQQTADYIVKLLPTVERTKARKLADLIVNHPKNLVIIYFIKRTREVWFLMKQV